MDEGSTETTAEEAAGSAALPGRLRQEAFTRRFRTSPSYTLRAFDDLGGAERRLLDGLEQGARFAALIQPRQGTAGSLKVIDGPTRELLLAFSVAQELSGSADTGFRSDIARMVLDGVLEVETPEGFIGGPAAHGTFFEGAATNAVDGAIAELSHTALRYAAGLAQIDRRALARRLYFFNTIPMRPTLSDIDETVERGSILSRPVSAALAHRWSAGAVGGWTAWRRDDSPNRGLAYKLYVSPHPDHHLDVLRHVLEVMVGLDVPAFKVGRGHLGLVRPDKFVAYFTSAEEMKRVAAALAPGLQSVRPHGVPFSAEMAHGPILSWGMDPDLDEGLMAWRGLESWRLMICNELAVSLVAGRNAGLNPDDAIRYATDRISLDGVDPDRWTPTAHRWAA